jgi:hypothetical protein
MKLITCLSLALIASTPAIAQNFGSGSSRGSTYVHGYMRGNGTYVQPHHRSAPNGTQFDNYGSTGNVNPYTGEAGSHSPDW